MATVQLSESQIQPMVGSYHPSVGFSYPPSGLQPYYVWLINALHQLAESSAAAFRVTADDASAMSVRIAPGRATIGSTILVYAAGVLDLASFNNQTALIWLADNAGQAQIQAADSLTGWPASAHIKLAEVTLEAGAITAVLDRRWETILKI